MSQPDIETLIDYWQARRKGEAAPARASIDPMDFPKLLPQVFMLGRQGPGDYVFRLVGGLVGGLHGQDLRGVDFTTLWAQHARLPLSSALEGARRRIAPIRITADAQSGQLTLPLSLVLLPLANAEGVMNRFLGFYQPTAPIARLRGQPIDRLVLASLDNDAFLDEPEQPRIRLVVSGGERVR